jgi:hypothetical protein
VSKALAQLSAAASGSGQCVFAAIHNDHRRMIGGASKVENIDPVELAMRAGSGMSVSTARHCADAWNAAG